MSEIIETEILFHYIGMEFLLMKNPNIELNKENSEIPLGLLVSMIHRAHMVYLNNRMKKLDLSAGQFPFLLVLFHHGGINQDEIAGIIHVDKGTAARALKKLEDKNLIFREIDSNNRRRYLIYLTEKGNDLIPEIIAIDNEWEDFLCCKSSTNEYDLVYPILKNLALKSMEKIERNGEFD